MRLETDWSEARNGRFSREPTPRHWPQGVRQLSERGSSLFGIHEDTGNLYWDGKLVETRSRLARFERLLAVAAAGSLTIIALITVIHFFAGR